MPIAGHVIIINSPNPEQAKALALSVRETEQTHAYYHTGLSTLTEHFLPSKVETPQPFMPALYCSISAVARCGGDVLCDLSISSKIQYENLKLHLNDLHIIWIDYGIDHPVADADLKLPGSTTLDKATQQVHAYLASLHTYAEAFSRWVPEVSPMPTQDPPGKIILLTGSSSAGKSTLSKAVQDLSDDIFLNVGIDTAVLYYLHLRYLIGVPEHEHDQSWRKPNFNPSTFHKQGCSWVAPGPNKYNPHDYLRFQVGKEGRRTISAMYATMAEMSRQGFNIISDHCFHFENAVSEALFRFQDLPVTYVSLCPTLETLRQREQQRGDRMEGMSESVYHQMITDYAADIHIDTGVVSPEDAAQQILGLIQN